MRSFGLFFSFALIVLTFVSATYAEDDIDAGGCMSLECDAKEYKPICGGLDAESSIGFMNECALSIYNCQHQTEWVVQTSVECDVAVSESSGK